MAEKLIMFFFFPKRNVTLSILQQQQQERNIMTQRSLCYEHKNTDGAYFESSMLLANKESASLFTEITFKSFLKYIGMLAIVVIRPKPFDKNKEIISQPYDASSEI